MRALTPVLFILFLTTSCSRPQAPQAPLDGTRDLAAILDGTTHTLYVREEWSDSLLGLIGAHKEGGEDRYSADLGGRGVEFIVKPVKAPQVYSPEQFGWFDTTKSYICRISFNAECGQGHPGFVAPCMPTFGPHRAFGNSMTWSVNNWKSCTSGKSWCVEVWKHVGTITYYPGPNCSDSIFVTRPIMEFRCD